MRTARRWLAVAAAVVWLAVPSAAAERAAAVTVLDTWYRLTLELVRHTPTQSPPVASRALAYLGLTAYETVASGSEPLLSLAGQLNGLHPVPPRPNAPIDAAVALDAALASVVRDLFANTGPTGRRAMLAVAARTRAAAAAGLPDEVVGGSAAYGERLAGHLAAWARDDGGAVVVNMGFPTDYPLTEAPGRWVPTSPIAQQQRPLLPGWGRNRTFAMPDGAACGLPPPAAYSEYPASDFYREALEVRDAVVGLDPEQAAIARFWSDDPMLTPTPPGHWISIALQVLDAEDADLETRVEVLAKPGVALADAFVACWHTKFEHDLLRPVTYIQRVIDPKWQPLLITPPFPEYPSGHSTQSAAAAMVLSAAFGENYAFEDATHADDGLPPRAFPSFAAAAEEAGISRLYGGIHFRSAIERGLAQGRCVGAYAVALRTRR
jgi:hypothetical protein